MDSGIGWTRLNKFHSVINIPCYDNATFKKYEKDIGETAKDVAKTTCQEAAAKERKLTIQYAEAIRKFL